MTPSPAPARAARRLQRSIAAACALLMLLTPPLHAQGLRSRAPVTVNFVNADIEGVTRAMATMIERQIAVDPRVKGTITVYSEQPQTVAEAWQNYLSALRGLGFAVVEAGGLLKVVPEAEAKLQTSTVSVGEVARRGDQVITQIFSLRHENPNNLVAVLRPLISANNTINASPGNNSLVITDYAENLQRIAKIIAALDQPNATEIEVIPLEHLVAVDVVATVQRLADGGGGIALPGVVSGGGATVLADSRTNSLIVRSANASRLAIVKAAVAKLDRPGAGGGIPGAPGMWVVHLKNADAAKLATVLRAAFAAGGGGSSGGPSSSPSPFGAPTANLSQQPSGSVLGGGRRCRQHRRHVTAGRLGPALHRWLYPGRPGDQLAGHHRTRCAVPPGARADRPARHPPCPGLHRKHDRRGLGRGRRRRRLSVAGRAGQR